MMLNIKFQGHWSTSSRERKVFTVPAWQPCWSCDMDCLNKFPQPQEALHEILFQLDQRFLRICLKLSQYENPESKIKECPLPLVFTNLRVLKKTVYTNF